MFQLNVEILQQSGLDKWRQTHLWSGYMTLIIVNLKGYWLWRKEIQKLNFIGNFNVGTPRRSGSDQWRQTDMWNGYMTLKIVNLRGFWLYERKFKTDIWSKYLILMIVNFWLYKRKFKTNKWSGYTKLMIVDLRGFWLNKWKFNSIKLHQCWDSSAIWFGPMPSNRHMERIPDTHDSRLEYQVWSKYFDFTKGNSILSS